MSDSANLIEVLQTAAEQTPETAAVGVTSYALMRFLGPSVNAISAALGEFTDFRIRNLLKLNEKFEQRKSTSARAADPDPDETIHPRVAKTILEEGSWIDDDLHQEYLAGLLAGATKSAQAEQSAYYTRVVAGMTAKQIELHYLIYRSFAGTWPDIAPTCPVDWDVPDRRRVYAMTMPTQSLEGRFDDSEISSLVREQLLHDGGVNRERPGTHAFMANPFGGRLFLAAVHSPVVAGGLNLICLSDARRAHMVAKGTLAHDFTLPDPEPVPLEGAVMASV